MAEERQHAPREHMRAAREPLVAAPFADELVHERARIGPRERGVRAPEMAQPAEAIERFAPAVGRRGEVEGGASAGRERPSGENEVSGVDIGGDGRVGGAQILRREQHPLRRRRSETSPGRERGRHRATGSDRLLQGKLAEPPAFRDPVHAKSSRSLAPQRHGRATQHFLDL